MNDDAAEANFEVEVPCPNGCQPGTNKPGEICFLCGGSGFASLAAAQKAEAYRKGETKLTGGTYRYSLRFC